jgi:hypothetical protein
MNFLISNALLVAHSPWHAMDVACPCNYYMISEAFPVSCLSQLHLAPGNWGGRVTLTRFLIAIQTAAFAKATMSVSWRFLTCTAALTVLVACSIADATSIGCFATAHGQVCHRQTIFATLLTMETNIGASLSILHSVQQCVLVLSATDPCPGSAVPCSGAYVAHTLPKRVLSVITATLSVAAPPVRTAVVVAYKIST